MLREAFVFAHTFTAQNGYSNEIEWQTSLSLEYLDEETFLREYAWVVLTSGMREAVVRKKFPSISRCFYCWRSTSHIARNPEACVRAALHVYRHEQKIRAIAHTATYLAGEDFSKFKEKLRTCPLLTLRSLPYIGPITQFHLAKNIGLDFAKPDRHLVRIARLFDYPSVEDFCQAVAKEVGTRVTVVDLVFWRFASLNTGYLEALRQFV